MARILDKICYIVVDRNSTETSLGGETITGTTVHAYAPSSKKITEEKDKSVIEECDNVPFDVTIVDINTGGYGRGYNSRHNYTVIDGEKRFLHIQEQEVAAALLQGIMPGGRTMAQFVWASETGGATPVCVGSERYNELVQLTQEYERDKEARLRIQATGESQYKVGHVYVKKNCGTKFLFLGKAKECDADTVYFAFLALAHNPITICDKTDESQLAYYREHYGSSVDYALRWDSMTLYEQQIYAWRIHSEFVRQSEVRRTRRTIPLKHYDNYSNVVMYTSPGFMTEDSSLNDVDGRLVAEVKEFGENHQWLNGQKLDKAEEYYTRVNGSPRVIDNYYNTSERERFARDCREWRKTYVNSLQWID